MHNPKSEILGYDKLPHLTEISSRDSKRLGKKIKKIFTPPHLIRDSWDEGMNLHDKVDLGVAQDSKEDKGQRCFVEDATPLNKSFAKLWIFHMKILVLV